MMIDDWKPNWVDQYKVAKKCTHCGRKMYGQTFMSAEGFWHKNNRCWNCANPSDAPWDIDNWREVSEGVIVIVKEDW